MGERRFRWRDRFETNRLYPGDQCKIVVVSSFENSKAYTYFFVAFSYVTLGWIWILDRERSKAAGSLRGGI